jgi:hypothetical protein
MRELREKQKRNEEHFIEKYGEEEGKKRYYIFCDKTKITLENMIQKYGKDIGECKYSEYISKQKNSHSYDQMVRKHGVERVKNMSASKANKGDKNGMFGKPSPINSGRGMCGYYKGNYFRSSLEYYYMKHLESQSKSYLCNDTAERSNPLRVVIPIGDGRNYIPDFIVDSMVVEIKAKWRLNAPDVLEKKKVAEEWCSRNGYTYHIVTEDDIHINKNIMNEDIENGSLQIKRNIQMRKKQ